MILHHTSHIRMVHKKMKKWNPHLTKLSQSNYKKAKKKGEKESPKKKKKVKKKATKPKLGIEYLFSRCPIDNFFPSWFVPFWLIIFPLQLQCLQCYQLHPSSSSIQIFQNTKCSVKNYNNTYWELQ